MKVNSIILFLFVIVISAHGERLRIATFNTMWLSDDPDISNLDPWTDMESAMEHIKNISKVIEDLQPDVITLQEVINETAIKQLLMTLHSHGYTAYRYYFIESKDSYTKQDIGVISNRDLIIENNKNIISFYSRNSNGPWREKYKVGKKEKSTSISKNILFYIEVNNKKLGLLSLHLKANPISSSANAQRVAQAKIARRIIDNVIIPSNAIPIVLGDFNDYDNDFEDRDPSLNSLTDVLGIIKGNNLINSVYHINDINKRYSVYWDKNSNMIQEEGEPLTLMDHILIDKSLESNIVDVFIDHKYNYSDHWPVVIDLDL